MSIKAGDLVMVVKPSPCCGSVDDVGRIFTVEIVELYEGVCTSCNFASESTDAIDGNDLGFPLGCLKKIDPPADGDSLPTRKDLGAAA